jgi:hypothetical protein
LRRESSRLDVRLSARTYRVAIHRKSRSLEVGVHFERQNDVDALAPRSAEVRRRLGPAVELEQTREGTRLVESTVLSTGDWSPKRDLTPDLVASATRRLLRFVNVIEPMMEQAARPASIPTRAVRRS